MAGVFSRRKDQTGEQHIKGILNALDADVLVVRGDKCQTLFISDSAVRHVKGLEDAEQDCPNGYARLFPALCGDCPNNQPKDAAKEEGVQPGPDVTDTEGRVYASSFCSIEWTDDKPATLIVLRDVSEERAAGEKLYNLAYRDSLTGVPNRQRFKEDFEKHSEDIAACKCVGMVALFDLDNFKTVNDTYGHNTGDIMLKRLTEHFVGDEHFRDHIYRLGGDEFVLLYVDPVEVWPSPDAMRRHYASVLQSALLPYTLPNIETACTLSMGASFFPEHGSTSSELLRKADIALYTAKSAGRNQLVFFEDRYDKAKKFKDLYINIQPVLTKTGSTYGYELIDQGNEDDGDGSVKLTGFDRTMDAIGMSDMEGEARYFIHCTDQLLNASVLRNLPKDKFVVEISAQGTTAAQLEQYNKLRAAGYQLALTEVTGTNAPGTLLDMASYVKFEPGTGSGPAIKKIIAQYPGKRFIATGVHTAQDLQAAVEQGFVLYQGFFFSEQAVVRKTKEIDPLKVNYLRLLKLTSTDDYVNFQEISTVIASDVALSYKLLRLLNSAALGLRNQISSIDMAVAYLGEESLKKWIALLALRGLASDKPLELIRISLVRAQFGELLAEQMTPRRDPRHTFLVGLLSLLHIALEKSKEDVFNEISVADDIRLSILTMNGPHSDLLTFFGNYEYANWDEVSQFALENKLTDRQINDAYIAAVRWFNELVE